MRRAPALYAVAGTALTAALLSGCSSEDPKPRTDPHSAPAPRPTGPLAKEARSMMGGHTRIEVKHVERHADRSVLRLHLTNLGQTSDDFSFGTSLASAAFSELHFNLVDPVGRKIYHPLKDKGGNGQLVGSATRTYYAEPGVRYETVLHFPPLPKDVQALTLVTPSTAGEFTGVPVVEAKGGTGPEAPVADPGSKPKPGSTVALPMHTQNGQTPHWVNDLHGIASGDVKTTSTSREEQRIGLRADVLFDFDKATLTPKAKAVLDDVAAQTKAEADPSKPPVIITGHTDGKGTPAYNRPLSQKRADAVLRELQTRLGTAYQYKAEGVGETRPVAKEGGADDEKARARNRRVEISYRIKQEKTRTTTGTTTGPVTPGLASGPPAAFRPTDGETVASRTIEYKLWGQSTKRRIDVKPFYRDGAYLVAVFEITNLGPRDLTALDSFSDGGVGKFAQFTVTDPTSRTTYEGVSIGAPNDAQGNRNLNRLDPGWATFQTEPNTTNRGFFYVPAPPPTTRTVTFNAAGFGTFPNIPIK